MIGFLSVAPLTPAWSQRGRAFIASVLRRAEATVEQMIFVQACLIAKRCGDDGRWIAFADLSLTGQVFSDADNSAPSIANLRGRFLALQYRLKHLRCLGERLFRRMKKKTARGAAVLSHAPADTRTICRENTVHWMRNDQCCAPEMWHPPREFSLRRDNTNSLRQRGGGVGSCAPIYPTRCFRKNAAVSLACRSAATFAPSKLATA